MQQRNCLDKIPLGLLGHRIDGQTALFNGKRGVLNEAFFKPHCLRLDRFLLRLVAHQKVDGFSICRVNGKSPTTFMKDGTPY